MLLLAMHHRVVTANVMNYRRLDLTLNWSLHVAVNEMCGGWDRRLMALDQHWLLWLPLDVHWSLRVVFDKDRLLNHERTVDETIDFHNLSPRDLYDLLNCLEIEIMR